MNDDLYFSYQETKWKSCLFRKYLSRPTNVRLTTFEHNGGEKERNENKYDRFGRKWKWFYEIKLCFGIPDHKHLIKYLMATSLYSWVLLPMDFVIFSDYLLTNQKRSTKSVQELPWWSPFAEAIAIKKDQIQQTGFHC